MASRSGGLGGLPLHSVEGAVRQIDTPQQGTIGRPLGDHRPLVAPVVLPLLHGGGESRVLTAHQPGVGRQAHRLLPRLLLRHLPGEAPALLVDVGEGVSHLQGRALQIAELVAILDEREQPMVPLRIALDDHGEFAIPVQDDPI